MENFLKYRCIKSAYWGIIFIYLILEWLTYASMYYGSYIFLGGCMFLYMLLPYILPKNNNKKSISFHIHRGLFIVINDVYKRQKGIMYFYVVIWILMLLMTLYLIKVSPLLGFFMVVVIMLCKIIMYYLLYNFSENLKNYQDFNLNKAT